MREDGCGSCWVVQGTNLFPRLKLHAKHLFSDSTRPDSSMARAILLAVCCTVYGTWGYIQKMHDAILASRALVAHCPMKHHTCTFIHVHNKRASNWMFTMPLFRSFNKIRVSSIVHSRIGLFIVSALNVTVDWSTVVTFISWGS